MSIQFSRMEIYESPIKIILVIFTLFFFILLLLYSVYQHRDVMHARLVLARDQTALVIVQKNFISKGFEAIVSDLLYLNKSPVFQKFLHEKNEKNNVENEWIVFLNSKKIYDQIRYIDLVGNEIIRVNLNKGRSAKTDDKYLQNKKERYYFTETLKLREGQLYLSKFDLNIENNELEVPIKPMLRFGLATFDQEKSKQGVLVVNYLGKNIINEVKKQNDENGTILQLLNEDSYWLAGPDSAKEWAFMYPDKNNENFKNQFPIEWSRISQEKNGQFFSSNGLFTFSTIYTVKELQSLLAEVNNESVQIEASDAVWFIISQVPSSSVEYASDKSSYIISIIRLFQSPLLLLSMITIALLLAILVVMYLSGKDKIKTLSMYDNMSGCLNRRSGIGIMQAMIQQNNDIIICFIDINGLKEVNDFLGYENGDDLILTTVKILQDSIRKTDILIRLGGDEFLICFPNITIEDAKVIWQSIIHKIEKINKGSDKNFLISLSHGMGSLKNEYGYSLDMVIKEADLKLCEEKNNIKSVGFSAIKNKMVTASKK